MLFQAIHFVWNQVRLGLFSLREYTTSMIGTGCVKLGPRTSHNGVLASPGAVADQPTVAGPVVYTSVPRDSCIVHHLCDMQGSLQAPDGQIAMPRARQPENKYGGQAFVVHSDLPSSMQDRRHQHQPITIVSACAFMCCTKAPTSDSAGD